MATPATYRWTPSNSRVIVLDGFGVVPRGTIVVPPQPLIWPIKDPSDVLDYVLDLSQALAGNEGDSISTLDVQIAPQNPGDLALQSSSADGDLAILWLSQGLAGTNYAVTMTIGTNNGRVLSRTIILPVLALAATAQVPGALVDQTGAALTDENEAPITTS